MTVDDRINNLLTISANLVQATEKNTSDIGALIEVVKQNSEDIKRISEDVKVLQLTVTRLTEGYHTHG